MANVVLIMGLFAVLAGAAYAATSIVGRDGVIHGCYATKGKAKGTLRLVKPGTKCKRGESAISWQQSGAPGPTGPKGDAGPAGRDGAPGARGPAGTDGEDGQRGPTGPAGTDGKAGPAGPTGPAGADGKAGPAGPTGPAGADGKAGPAGPTGPAGADGKPGPAGPTGPAGPAAIGINMTLGPNGDLEHGLVDGIRVALTCPVSPQRLRVYFYGPNGSGAQLGGARSTNDANAIAVTAGRALEPFNAPSPILELSTTPGNFQRQNGTVVFENAGAMKSVVYDAFLEMRDATPVCRLRGTLTRAG